MTLAIPLTAAETRWEVGISFDEMPIERENQVDIL
jgi:hypothetical protein